MKCFAIAAPGLEPVLEEELRELGIKGKAIPGGVEWNGSESSIALANLWSRIASRIVVRIGDAKAIRNLYAQLGNVARAKFDGWDVAMLSASKAMDSQTQIEFEEKFKTTNGGIPVRLVVSS